MGGRTLDIMVEPGSDLDDFPTDCQSPLISVIVPARNEGRNIERCTRALFAANLSKLRDNRGR